MSHIQHFGFSTILIGRFKSMIMSTVAEVIFSDGDKVWAIESGADWEGSHCFCFLFSSGVSVNAFHMSFEIGFRGGGKFYHCVRGAKFALCFHFGSVKI